jgi:hypothetical protein
MLFPFCTLRIDSLFGLTLQSNGGTVQRGLAMSRAANNLGIRILFCTALYKRGKEGEKSNRAFAESSFDKNNFLLYTSS